MKHIIVILVLLVISLGGCRDKTSSELYSEGVAEARKGNSSGAIVIFRSALEKDPNRIDVRHELAKAYLATAKYELAEREFQKVQRLNPSMQEISLELAKLYNLMNKSDQAIDQAEKYLSGHPGSADAMEALGIAHVAKNQPAEAEEHFVRALAQEPDRSGTKLELAALYVKTDNSLKATQLLTEVIRLNPTGTRAYYLLADLEIAQGRKEKALEIYRKITEISKNEPEAHYKAGLISLDSGDLATAGKGAEELIARFPKRAEGYRLKGIVSFRQNNFPEAIASLQNSVKIQPSLAGYYYLGLSLYNQGELENALSQFHQLLDRAPSVHQARILVGLILLRQQRFDDAINEISRVLQSDDRNAIAHNILGSAYMAKGKYDEGMKELNRATELNPRLIDAHLKKGEFHLSQGNLDGVASDLKAAVRVAPELLNTRLMLASFYLRNNKQEKALDTLKDGLTGQKGDTALYTSMARIMFAAKKPAQGVTYLHKAMAADPTAHDAGFMLAAHYAVTGETGKAQQQYDEILRREPANIDALLSMAALFESKGRPVEAEEYFQKAKQTRNPVAYAALAKRFAKKKDYRQAIALLDEGLGHAPRTLALLELKGELQLQDKQYKEAMKTLDDIESISPERGIKLKVTANLMMNNNAEALANARRALTLGPESAGGYILLASVYKRQNDREQAIQALKNGIRIDAGNSQANLMLAELYSQGGNNPQAIKTCEDLLRKQPGNVSVQFALGNYLEASGRKKEAVKSYQKVLALNENFYPALNNLAYLFAEGYGNKAQAVKLAEAALAKDADNPRVMDTLGYALLKNGRTADARKTLELASSHIPDNPTINYHLALVYQEMGEKGLAAEKLRKSLQSGHFAEAEQAKLLLSKIN